jgi:hypothetical protein
MLAIPLADPGEWLGRNTLRISHRHGDKGFAHGRAPLTDWETAGAPQKKCGKSNQPERGKQYRGGGEGHIADYNRLPQH